MTKQVHGTKSPIRKLWRVLPIAAVLLLFALVLVAPAAAVDVSSQQDLENAIVNANGPIEIVLSGISFTFPDVSMADKNITFTSTVGAEIDMTTPSGSTSGATIIFDGVKVTFANANYKGLQHSSKVVYKNCVINGTQFMYAPEVEFIKCTFNKADDTTEYNVWTYGSTDVTFTDCTFNTGGKAILVYIEAEIHADITLNNCIFYSDGTIDTGKAAVEVGSSPYSNATTYNITINNCTIASGFSKNKSNSPLWGNKNSMDSNHLTVTIDGEKVTGPYTVTWDFNGGTSSSGESTYTQTTDELCGTVDIVKPADPTKEGYTFAGWDPEFIDGSKINSTVVYTAQWTVNSYTVTAADGITNGTITVPADKVAYNESVSITVTPNEDFEIGTVSVQNTDTQEAVLNSTENGVVTFRMPAGNVTVSVEFSAIVHTEAIIPGKAATCTETGLTEGKKCADCEKILVEPTVIDALGHKNQTIPAVDATCIVAGSTAGLECTVCHEVFTAPVAVPALGHKNQTIPAVDATCTVAGSTAGLECTVCHEVFTAPVVVPVLGHKNQTIPAVDATCTVAGSTAGLECTVCHEVFTAPVAVPALGHKNQTIPAVDATCTVAGSTAGLECTVCHEVFTAPIVVPVLGHKNQTIPAVDATCTVAGSTSGLECTVCHEVFTEPVVIPALGHDNKTIPAVAANCTVAGSTEGIECTACDTILVAPETVDALGHTNVTIPAVAANCTVAGSTEGIECTTCNTVLVAPETVDALGHTEETLPGKAPTYTETGLTEGKHCSVCKEILVKQEEITVLIAVADTITLNPTNTTYTLKVGESTGLIQAAATNKSDETATFPVTWAITAGTDNVTITPAGNNVTITAANAGTATVTATAGDVTKDITVTIEAPAPAAPVADKITLTPATPSHVLNETAKEERTIEAVATNKTNATATFPVIWKVIDTDGNITTTTSGNSITIKAVKEGVATVTATAGTATESVTISVVKPIEVVKVEKPAEVKPESNGDTTLSVIPSETPGTSTTTTTEIKVIEETPAGEQKAEITNEDSGVKLTVTFAEGAVPKKDDTTNPEKVTGITGKVTAVAATYDEKPAAASKEVGEVKFQLNLNINESKLSDAVTKLPKVDANLKQEVVTQVFNVKPTWKPATMITADKEINKFLTGNDDGVEITFTLEKAWVETHRDNLVWFHVNENGKFEGQGKLTNNELRFDEDTQKYIATIKGAGFSTYGIAVEEPKQETGKDDNTSTGGKPSSPSSGGNSYWAPSTPTPTETPTEQPTETPTDAVPTDVPTTQPTQTETQSPGFGVLAIAAGLGAALALRRT